MEAGDACGCWDRCVMSKVKVKTVKVTPVVLAKESKDEVNETMQKFKQRLAEKDKAFEAQQTRLLAALEELEERDAILKKTDGETIPGPSSDASSNE